MSQVEFSTSLLDNLCYTQIVDQMRLPCYKFDHALMTSQSKANFTPNIYDFI